MQIKITLLSDLCVASGEIYNSLIDTEVSYDAYGFPFIQGKRLKGCLRESALELVDWGMMEEEVYHKIFGVGGCGISALKLSDGRLENYTEYVHDIQLAQSEGEIIVHPQNVLSLFTYIRTQTEINACGVAEEKTLRTMRVIKKNSVFLADAELDEKYIKSLCDACKNLHYIGLNRTRGLGQVKVELLPKQEKERKNWISKEKLEQEKAALTEENRIFYWINLETPVLFKGPAGGQQQTQKYIEGNKIMGLLAEGMGQQAFRKYILDKGVRCSNAYRSDMNQRYIPGAASYHIKKDQEKENGKLTIRDRIAECQECKEDRTQISPVSNVYFSKENQMETVVTEINYHHSRPEDKAIGRALGEGAEESVFYQLSSLSSQQVFSGFIDTDKESGEKVLETLYQIQNTRMGYNKSAGYGEISIRNLQVTQKKERKEEKEEFIIRLVSPVIVYNHKGMYSTNFSDIEREIAAFLGKEVSITQKFLKYTDIGGYNVTWNRPKPTLSVFDMGTICKVRVKDGSAVSVPFGSSVFLGERSMEGFGEVLFQEVPKEYYVEAEDTKEVLNPKNREYATDLIRRLKRKAYLQKIKTYGRKCAGAPEQREKLKQEATNPVISKLLMVFREKSTQHCLDYNKMQEEISQLADNDISLLNSNGGKQKKDTAMSFLEYEQKDVIEQAVGKADCREVCSDGEIAYAYFNGFLHEAKYIKTVYARKGKEDESDVREKN